MLWLREVERKIVEDLGEVVFSVLGGEGDDVLEDDASSGMGPLGPHLDELFNASPDGLRGVFDVGVPDLMSSHSGHLKLVVLHDVHCHESSVVGVGLVLASCVVHVALYDVQDLPYQDYSCIPLLPVLVEGPVTQWLQQQVSMAQTIVVNKYFFDQHS